MRKGRVVVERKSSVSVVGCLLGPARFFPAQSSLCCWSKGLESCRERFSREFKAAGFVTAASCLGPVLQENGSGGFSQSIPPRSVFPFPTPRRRVIYSFEPFATLICRLPPTHTKLIRNSAERSLRRATRIIFRLFVKEFSNNRGKA